MYESGTSYRQGIGPTRQEDTITASCPGVRVWSENPSQTVKKAAKLATLQVGRVEWSSPEVLLLICVASLARTEDHPTLNQRVVGSSPTGGTFRKPLPTLV